MAPPPEQRVARPERLVSQRLSCFWPDGPSRGGRFMLVGELDLATADLARAAIRRAQRRASALICDLGDVWFVDFAGLRVLLEAADRARQTGASLTIANSPPIVPRMLAELQLQGALDIQAARVPAAPPVRHARRGRLSNRPAHRAID